MPHLSREWVTVPGWFLAALLAVVPSAVRAQDAAGEGKQIFTTEAQPQCGICHVLADAGAEGEIGPNLDDLKPTEEQVRAAVADGVGVMPAYKETLDPEQIAAVAEYVAEAVGHTQ